MNQEKIIKTTTHNKEFRKELEGLHTVYVWVGETFIKADEKYFDNFVSGSICYTIEYEREVTELFNLNIIFVHKISMYHTD